MSTIPADEKQIASYTLDQLYMEWTQYDCRALSRNYIAWGQELPVLDDENAWRYREAMRMHHGTYRPILMEHLPSSVVTKAHYQLFVHMSVANTTFVAYTPNAEKGKRNIQVKLSYGKFLKTNFKDVLSDKEIEASVAAFKHRYVVKGVSFASTKEEIERVYVNGPHSCMQYDADDEHFSTTGIHPTHVYAGPDTQLAYIERDSGKISARSIVTKYTDRPNHYIRIYGDELLGTLLESLGYTRGTLQGARLLKIPIPGFPDNWLMPYLDGGAVWVEPFTDKKDDEDYWVVSDTSGYRTYEAQTQDGVIGNGKRPPNSYNQCYHCGGNMDAEDFDTIVFEGEHRNVCYDCSSDNYTTCDTCDRVRLQDQMLGVYIHPDNPSTHRDSRTPVVCEFCVNNGDTFVNAQVYDSYGYNNLRYEVMYIEDCALDQSVSIYYSNDVRTMNYMGFRYIMELNTWYKPVYDDVIPVVSFNSYTAFRSMTSTWVEDHILGQRYDDDVPRIQPEHIDFVRQSQQTLLTVNLVERKAPPLEDSDGRMLYFRYMFGREIEPLHIQYTILTYDNRERIAWIREAQSTAIISGYWRA